jgi:hypothetical protein
MATASSASSAHVEREKLLPIADFTIGLQSVALANVVTVGQVPGAGSTGTASTYQCYGRSSCWCWLPMLRSVKLLVLALLAQLQLTNVMVGQVAGGAGSTGAASTYQRYGQSSC